MTKKLFFDTSCESQTYSEDTAQDYNFRGEFHNNCARCGLLHVLYTQADTDPEYYIKVTAECPKCGGYVQFQLPVN